MTSGISGTTRTIANTGATTIPIRATHVPRTGFTGRSRPLGIYTYQGSKNNNILGFGTHGVTVFLDSRAPRIERFKAVGVRQHAGCQWWVYGGTSADGLHWKWRDEPLLKKNADTANVCIRDGDVYRLYLRMWSGPAAFTGQRIIGYTESTRFGSFRDPTAILGTDKDDPAKAQFYNPAAARNSGRPIPDAPVGPAVRRHAVGLRRDESRWKAL